MLPSSGASSSSTGGSLKSDRVRKVRLRTTSGVLTLCYGRPSLQAAASPQAVVDKHTNCSSQVSSSKEPAFDSLPELVECKENFSVSEDGCSSPLVLRPDYSAYNFWTSDSESGYPAPNFPDSISFCGGVAVPNHSPGLTLDIFEPCPHLFPAIPDPTPQYSVNTSAIEQDITDSRYYWDFPLEYVEEIFQSNVNRDILTSSIDARDGDSMIDEYLVKSSPPFCAKVEPSDIESNLLIYPPSRYVEEACIFQSLPGPTVNENTEVERLGKFAGSDQNDMRGLPEASTVDGQRALDGKRSPPPVTGVQAENPCGPADFVQYGHHRRRRHCAPSMQRSKLMKLLPHPIDKASMTQWSRDSGPRDRFREQKQKGVDTSNFSPKSTDLLTGFSNQNSGTLATTSKLSTNPSLRRKRTETDFRYSLKNRTTNRGPNDCPELSTVKKSPCESPVISEFTSPDPLKIRKLRTPTSPNSLHFRAKGTASQNLLKLLRGNRSTKPSTGAKRPPLPQKSVEILQEWLNEHLPDAYPSRDEKNDLILQTGLKLSQVENWLGNARQKIKLQKCKSAKDLGDSSPEQSTKRSKRKRYYPLKIRV